jgi:hypothetical protein
MSACSYWVRVTNQEFREVLDELWTGLHLQPLGSSMASSDGKHWLILVRDENLDAPKGMNGQIVQLVIANGVHVRGVKRIIDRIVLPDSVL